MEATLAVVLFALVIVGNLTDADARIKGAVGNWIGDVNRPWSRCCNKDARTAAPPAGYDGMNPYNLAAFSQTTL